MVNQWGRDGNFPSSGGRSSGVAGVIIAAIVALVLGAGGGYTGARLFAGGSTSEIAARDSRIADLERQISDLKFQNDGSVDQESELRNRVEELTKANATLKQLVDENSGKAGAEAQAEIDALKKTIDEAGDLRAELGRAKRSLQVSELQIIELEATIRTQRGEIDKLRKGLSDVANQGDAGVKALSERIKVLEAALADSRKQAQAAGDLRKKITALQDELATSSSEVSAAKATAKTLQKELDRAKSDVARLKKELDAARSEGADKGGEWDALRRDLDAARAALATREADIQKLQSQLGAVRKDLETAVARADEAESDRASLQSMLDTANAEKHTLDTEIDRLTKTIETLEAAQSEDAPKPDVPDETEPLLARRDADLVRVALEDMPGYARLKPEQQADLARRLEEGECVADSLKTVLGRVPTVALRNLIRDLGSKC